MTGSLDIVILGLSITSSWGNGHATTYRGLVRELSARGHRVLFLERDAAWYAENRDLPSPPWGRTSIYGSLDELKDRFHIEVASADAVIVGSYVPEGIEVGRWVQEIANGVTAFYDIDTPVTLANLQRGECSYLTRELVEHYDLYLSFTGGPTLDYIEKALGSPAARPLYCSVDPRTYYPEESELRWDLGYLGTYSADRQPVLERLLIEPARSLPGRHFIVAGPQYPENLEWPPNVERETHIAPSEHRGFYNAQRFTLNVSRVEMMRAGYSPSVRLFEAAACAVPIISDCWPGLDEFFIPGHDIFTAESADDVRRILEETTEEERLTFARRARERVLRLHTAAHRAEELEGYVHERMHESAEA
ncbi:MAG: glycosyltransferase [Thermoanaerobaculia bacterium]